MASRKRPTEPPSEAALVVVLEDIRAQNKVFGEALGSFREQVDRRFEQVDRQFDQVAHQFEDVHRAMRGGFEQVDQRLARLETDTRLIKLAVIDQAAELKKKVNRDEVEALVERARLSR